MGEYSKGEWAVAYKDQGLGHGMYGVVVKDTNEVVFEDLTMEEADEIVRRWNSQPALIAACESADKEFKEILNEYMERDAVGRRAKLPIERKLETAIAEARGGEKR